MNVRPHRLVLTSGLLLSLALTGCAGSKAHVVSTSAPYNDISPVPEHVWGWRFMQVMGAYLSTERSPDHAWVCGAVSRWAPRMRPGITIQEALDKAGLQSDPGLYAIALYRSEEGCFRGVQTYHGQQVHPASQTPVSLTERLQPGDAVVVLEKLVAF